MKETRKIVKETHTGGWKNQFEVLLGCMISSRELDIPATSSRAVSLSDTIVILDNLYDLFEKLMVSRKVSFLYQYA